MYALGYLYSGYVTLRYSRYGYVRKWTCHLVQVPGWSETRNAVAGPDADGFFRFECRDWALRKSFPCCSIQSVLNTKDALVDESELGSGGAKWPSGSGSPPQKNPVAKRWIS